MGELRNTWRWLSEADGLTYDNRYEIFIVSNQMCRRKHIGREEYYAQWKKKLDLVAQEVRASFWAEI
jgi:hypothetical protein